MALSLSSIASPSQLLPLWQVLKRVPGGGVVMGRLAGRMAPYTGTIRPEVLTLEKGYARVRMRDTRRVRNHLNSVHAIALMNLGEVSTGMAVITALPEGARGITIEISSGMLFAAGDSVLSAEAEQVLRAMAAVLAQGDFPITVEGHSDNTPISNPRFPSNWELSAVRAASVARLLAESGIGAGQLSAVGYGDQRPLESNLTPEGRARNRRVAVLIESLAPEARSESAAGAASPKI